MRVSLALLRRRDGSFSWQLAGPFGHFLEKDTPVPHTPYPRDWPTLSAKSWWRRLTWVALGIISLGLLAWWWRDRLVFLADRFNWLAIASSKELSGFERINEQVVGRDAGHCQRVCASPNPANLSWKPGGHQSGGLVAVPDLSDMGRMRMKHCLFSGW